MTIYDLIMRLGDDVMLGVFFDEFLMFSKHRDSQEFIRAYGTLYGYLWSLRDQDLITALDFSSVIQSIKQEGGMEV